MGISSHMLDTRVKHMARRRLSSRLLAFRRVKTTSEIRRENLDALLASVGGNQAELARRVDRSAKQVNQWFGKGSARNMGDETCRALELAFGKPRGWMDNDQSQSARFDRETLAAALKMVNFLARMQATDAARFSLDAEAQADAILVALEILSRDPSQVKDLAGASERMAAQLRGERNEQVDRRGTVGDG